VWALKTKRGSFIQEQVIEFDKPHFPCLFRTKRHAMSYLSENKHLFPTATPVEVTVCLEEKKPSVEGKKEA
jgi:hypothetical protein